jgi:mannose-6-phosphate isomerase-like protein (cupin superfamily)
MKSVRSIILGLCILAGTAPYCVKAAAPAIAAAPAAAASPFPVEPPGNDETGISIDRYIGDATNSPAKISHDTMYIQRIFSSGEAATGSAGAVLAPGEQTDLATLMPHDVTSLFTTPKELIFYVESGKGRLDDGKQYWDISNGIGMMIPPNTAHRLTNLGDEPLKMIMFSFNPTYAPPKDIVVRDSHKVLMIEHNVHWSHNSKLLFGPEAGVSRVLVITFAPMTIAGPHASPLNTDPKAGGVQWIHVGDGPMLFQLGSELRRWPINTGFVTPLDGQTVHARYNIGDTVQTTLFINSGSSMPAASRGTGPALPTFWHNPPLKGEASSPAIAESYLKDSVVLGRALPK